MKIAFVLFITALSCVNTSPVKRQAPEPFVMGDMLFMSNPKFSSRNANIQTGKWTDGVIPYIINPNSGYTDAHKATIINSMRKIEEQTNRCITFKERTTETSYIFINHTTTGCNAYVGRIASYWQPQQVSLQIPGCIYQSVIIHELMHAIGFEHEQCRTDRDEYVKIIYGNVQKGLEFAFDAIPASRVSSFDTPYDYYSIMQYRSDAFSVNGRHTIVPRDPTVDITKMGRSDVMSANDIYRVKKLYNCPL